MTGALRVIAPKHKASPKACPEQATARRRVVGRGSVRTGVSRPPADDAWPRTNEPAARCRAQKILAGDPSPKTEPSMNRSFPSPQRFICAGSCVFQGRPKSPGSDGASPYRLEHRSMVRPILLVVVVLLVLDLLWGSTRSPRVTRAARFGVESRSGAVEVGSALTVPDHVSVSRSRSSNWTCRFPASSFRTRGAALLHTVKPSFAFARAV
jgi:hypothetical protein